MAGPRSVGAALRFYYSRLAAGRLRGVELKPPDAEAPDRRPYPWAEHETLFLLGLIGALLRTEPWVDSQGRIRRPVVSADQSALLCRIYGPPGLDPGDLNRREIAVLEAVERRLGRRMLARGIICPDEVIDGFGELVDFLKASPPTVRRLLTKYPVRRLGGRRLVTLKSWVEQWIDGLPVRYRSRWRAYGRLEG
ncbi:MAG: hypothetical protein KJ621_14960 [Proteobacteria bacterium]|nr:hypothetical protein [Pseudomonadota bacterium]MBU1742741.1 hypothetical protein [Pseudomonadota bacterium]